MITVSYFTHVKTLHPSIVIILLLVVFSSYGIVNASIDSKSETKSNSVLFMKTNSTGEIFMKWSPYRLIDSTYDVTLNVYRIGSPLSINSSDLTITPNPEFINFNKGPAIIEYTITTKNNVKGVYDMQLFRPCGEYSPLLVVGLNESKVNPSIFYNNFVSSSSCPAYSPPADQTIINYSGIISKNITVDITKIPPLKQTEGFIAERNIICKQGFVHLQKLSDNSPACVTPATFIKLISLKWGFDPINEWTFEGLMDTYKAGKQINFVIRYQGLGFVCPSPSVWVKDQNNAILWHSNNMVELCRAQNRPSYYVNQVWEIGNSSELGSLVLGHAGTYSVVVGWQQSPPVMTQKIIIVS